MKEIWKSIEGYEGLYEVSDQGRVMGIKRGMVLKLSDDNRGYLKVVLCKDGIRKTRTVHQLVAEAFLGHKPCGMKLVVNHINFNKHDNRPCNLEITTQRENTNKKHLPSSSEHTGVTWYKQNEKWRSQIVINGKLKHLGYFNTEIEAYKAYQKALK